MSEQERNQLWNNGIAQETPSSKSQTHISIDRDRAGKLSKEDN